MRLILLTSLLYASPSLGEQSVGNGGHGVKCTNATTITYDFLDVYEVKAAGDAVDLGPIGSTVEEKIDVAMQRLRRLDSNRSAIYAREATDFMNRTLVEVSAPVTEDQGGSFPFCSPQRSFVSPLMVQVDFRR